jgi:hypothetical protein
MTDAPTMKEKREQLRNTYLAHTHDDTGGRFSKVAPNNVIGSSPVSYPRLPQSSPWSAPDPSGPEQPYPIDLSEPPEPVGTAQEINDSLKAFSWERSDYSEGPSRQHVQHARPGASGVSIGPAGFPNPLSASASSPVGAGGDDAEVKRAVTGTARPSLPASGAGNTGSTGPAPTHPRANLMRRLR